MSGVTSKINRIVFKVLPIKKNRWVFTSFSGHYSDNPKYISLKLHEKYPEIEIVWLVKKIYFNDLPSFVRCIEFGSLEALKYLSSAEVIVDNVYGDNVFIVSGKNFLNKLKQKIRQLYYYKKGQTIISTWHGTPLKRMGRDQIGSNITNYYCNNIKMVLGNQYTYQIMKHMTFDKIPMCVLGTPRNDVLFEDKSEYYKSKLKLPLDKKIILFAPTFRKDDIKRSGLNQLEMINFDLFFDELNMKFSGDWVLVCRFHYHVSEMIDWEQLRIKTNNRIINGNEFDDMAEYLASSDILITDASSSMFDFAITKRPCFLFFPDIEYYENEERGFYTSIQSLPFPCAHTFSDLLKCIHDFDDNSYACSVDELMSEFGYSENGNASSDVVDWIFSKI